MGVDWDKNNLLRNYSFNILTQFGAALVSFFIVWTITRYSGTEVLAITVAVTAGSQAVVLFSNWTSIAVMRLGGEEFLKTQKISFIFSAKVAILICNIAVLILFYPLWSGFLIRLLKIPEVAGPYLLCQFVLMSFIAHFTSGFQAVKLLRIQGLLLLTEKGISLLIILAFSLFFGATWQNFMLAYLTAAAVVIIIAIALIRKFYSFHIEWKYVKQVLRFSFPLLPYGITAFLTTSYLDTFFISNYLEKNDLGVYSVAYQFYGFWMQLPTILGGLMMPMFISYIVRDHLDVIEKYLKESMHIILLIWALFSAILAFSLCIIIPLAFGIKHPQLNSILIIFILGTTFSVPNFIGFAPYTLARKVIFFAFPLAIITAGVNFLGNYFLIPRYGLIGSTYSSILATIAGFISSYLFMVYYFKVNTIRSVVSLGPSLLGILLCFWTSNILIILVSVLLFASILLFLYWNNFTPIIGFVKNNLGIRVKTENEVR
jgi:O-antigen/teichoic acid export membrane protein